MRGAYAGGIAQVALRGAIPVRMVFAQLESAPRSRLHQGLEEIPAGSWQFNERPHATAGRVARSIVRILVQPG